MTVHCRHRDYHRHRGRREGCFWRSTSVAVNYITSNICHYITLRLLFAYIMEHSGMVVAEGGFQIVPINTWQQKGDDNHDALR